MKPHDCNLDLSNNTSYPSLASPDHAPYKPNYHNLNPPNRNLHTTVTTPSCHPNDPPDPYFGDKMTIVDFTESDKDYTSPRFGVGSMEDKFEDASQGDGDVLMDK